MIRVCLSLYEPLRFLTIHNSSIPGSHFSTRHNPPRHGSFVSFLGLLLPAPSLSRMKEELGPSDHVLCVASSKIMPICVGKE